MRTIVGCIIVLLSMGSVYASSTDSVVINVIPTPKAIPSRQIRIPNINVIAAANGPIRVGGRDYSEETFRSYIGQMFLVGFTGNSTKSPGFRVLKKLVSRGQVGGVLFLKNNVANRSSVKAMTTALKSAAPGNTPLFIAIDQEGGWVQRLTLQNSGVDNTNSAQKIATLGLQKAIKQYGNMAKNLAEIGFNLNFGPVVDLNVNRSNPIIGKLKRSYSADANTVVQYASVFIKAHREYGILTSLKHYPGHGSSTRDSHNGFVDISKSWSVAELIPYQKLIETRQVDSIMVGHLFNAQIDGEAKTPASLSRKTIRGSLRDHLRYNGIVISDDMYMGAIRNHYRKYDAMIQAIRAGNDVLIYSTYGTAKKMAAMINKMLEFARKDPAFAQLILESHQRIHKQKRLLAAMSINIPDYSITTASIGDTPEPDTGELDETLSEGYILWSGTTVKLERSNVVLVPRDKILVSAN